MLCEWCGKEFNSISKCFCSKSYRAKFAVSKVKKHVCNFPKHKNSKTNKWKCIYCGKSFNTRRLKQEHVKYEHPERCKKFGIKV